MLRWLVGGGLAIILGAFGIFLATPQPVQACSCVVFTPPEQLEMASTVFHGRVTAMEPFTPAANSPKPWLDTAVQFEVDTVWKGTVAENIVIAVVGANEACGFEFGVGEEYLVYADGPPFYGTGWCEGTKVFAGDVAHLGEGMAPLPGIDEQALAYDQRHIDAAAVAAAEPEPPPLAETPTDAGDPGPAPVVEAPRESVEPDPPQVASQDAGEPGPAPAVEAPRESVEPDPPQVASQDAGEPGWIWIAVGISVAAVAGVAFAITWARRRGKFSV